MLAFRKGSDAGDDEEDSIYEADGNYAAILKTRMTVTMNINLMLTGSSKS